MRVDVEVRDAHEAAQLVDRLARRLKDGRPQLHGLVDQLVEAERERFAGRGARWRKLKTSTLARDRRGGRDPRPMRVTGRLAESLTRKGHPDMVVRVRPGELRFGTRVFYARFHQKGEGVPKRTVVGLTRVQRARLVDGLRRLFFEHL